MSSDENLTAWLGRISEGDGVALEHVVRLLYDEIRFLAHQRLHGERHDHTLATTTLVNEVYLKQASPRRINAAVRGQLMSAAAGKTSAPGRGRGFP